MARPRKHKADGLFYVTQQMLYGNSACNQARLAVARWQAILRNPKVRASELLLVWADTHDDARIPVTIRLIRYLIEERSVGGVHHWLRRAVNGYAEESLNWQDDAIKLPDPFSIPMDQMVMDILLRLAKRRGLIQ